MESNRLKHLLMAAALLLAVFQGDGHAGESTFDIGPGGMSVEEAASMLGESAVIEKMMAQMRKAGWHRIPGGYSDGRERGLAMTIMVQEAKVRLLYTNYPRIAESVYPVEMQGLRRLLYILIFTDERATAPGSVVYVRYTTIALTSENLLYIAELKTMGPMSTSAADDNEKRPGRLAMDQNGNGRLKHAKGGF